MGLIAKDLPTLVFMLLPGFVAAGVFYTLTAHPKSSEFERLIQALIFTAILKLLSILIKGAALWLGTLVVLGEWTSDVELAFSIALALPLGLSFALLANNDTFHKVLRRRSVTTRTSYPSEWYSAFARGSRWLILHLKDRRRLYGWPREWPDQPEKGHFLLDHPEWLTETGERLPMDRVAHFLVPASEVNMVEFLLTNQEASQRLIEGETLPRSSNDPSAENIDGSESAATGTQSPPEKPKRLG